MTPWTAACQAPLSSSVSWSFLRFMSIESVMLSNHLILCCPLLLLPSIFPRIRVFSNKSAFASGGQSIGASASASVLPMNIQGWFPLGLIGLISLLSKGLSRVFFSSKGDVRLKKKEGSICSIREVNWHQLETLQDNWKGTQFLTISNCYSMLCCVFLNLMLRALGQSDQNT